MSQYLVERLHHAANVKVETGSQVMQLSGDDRLRTIVVRDGDGAVAELAVGGLFVMIGADPCTGWLRDAVQLDDHGFVLTGSNCDVGTAAPRSLFETSCPGVFAVGDVRSGSVKRVASAVGEGSVVVQAVHARLAALRENAPVTV
jgi:thioredoxin reductase (NADPH)